jgi:hypothetical protein
VEKIRRASNTINPSILVCRLEWLRHQYDLAGHAARFQHLLRPFAVEERQPGGDTRLEPLLPKELQQFGQVLLKGALVLAIVPGNSVKDPLLSCQSRA